MSEVNLICSSGSDHLAFLFFCWFCCLGLVVLFCEAMWVGHKNRSTPIQLRGRGVISKDPLLSSPALGSQGPDRTPSFSSWLLEIELGFSCLPNKSQVFLTWQTQWDDFKCINTQNTWSSCLHSTECFLSSLCFPLKGRNFYPRSGQRPVSEASVKQVPDTVSSKGTENSEPFQWVTCFQKHIYLSLGGESEGDVLATENITFFC